MNQTTTTMSDLELTNEVYETDSGVVGPRFLDQAECQELLRKCRKLLSLTGAESIAGHHFLDVVEGVARDAGLATEEDMQIIANLYEQREREAHLNGKPWEDVA